MTDEPSTLERVFDEIGAEIHHRSSDLEDPPKQIRVAPFVYDAITDDLHRDAVVDSDDLRDGADPVVAGAEVVEDTSLTALKFDP